VRPPRPVEAIAQFGGQREPDWTAQTPPGWFASHDLAVAATASETVSVARSLVGTPV
jgi:hypothetical protein